MTGEFRTAPVVVAPYAESDRDRWDDYVARHPDGGFGQRTAFRTVTSRCYGVEPLWWLATRANRVVGVLPMFQRRLREPALFSAPGGMLRDDDEVERTLVASLTEAVRARRLRYAELRDQRTPLAGLPSSDEHVTMVLDLAGSAEEQWAAFSGRARTGVRKAEKLLDGYTVDWGPGQIERFHGVLLENMRDLGTPLRGIAYFRAFLAAYGDDADVAVLRSHDQTIGGMITVRHGATITDPWASSSRRWFHASPNDAIYWEAIRRAIAQGARKFDFGRSQPDSGTYNFKLKWGARPVPLAYQYVLGRNARIPTLADQKSSLGLAVRMWRALPLPVAGVLGEPAKRMFPEVL